MHRNKCRRKHQRHKITKIQPLQLSNAAGGIFFVVPIDESESGIGAIYTGKNPPRIGSVFMVGDDSNSRKMEVRWVAPLGTRRFRFGMTYLD
jgi:hypothetical protein